MSPDVEAALEAAARAAEAACATPGRYRGTKPTEVLEDRLGPLDWSSFTGRGYRLLRALHARLSEREGPTGGTPDGAKAPGAKYEAAYSRARERLVRAMTVA